MRLSLVITVGATPQIVTETVYGLLTDPAPFIPHAIFLVTTTRAATVFEPFTRPGNKLEQLYSELGLAESYVVPRIIPVIDKEGAKFVDVRTEREAIAFGNTVTKLVAELAEDATSRIHVSLAGGRKTMGWYAGAALSLFGRDQDELSHVLVEHGGSEPEALEGCEDFWWPTKHDDWVPHKYLRDENGKPRLFNAKEGRIDLARIPFVRLKPILSEAAFPEDEIDYEAVVAAVAENVSAHRLRLVIDDRTVCVGRHRVKLGHQQFAFYALLATARKERWPPARGTGLGNGYFGWLSLHDLGSADSIYLQKFYELVVASHRTDNEARTIGKMLERARKELREDYDAFLNGFSQLKSKISGDSGTLRRKLSNPTLRDRIDIKTDDNAEGLTCFGLLLEPSQIEIAESD